MNTATQRTRAETFRAHHSDRTSEPLILPNSWDVASTIIYQMAGFEAVGTSSAGIAATLGVPDGEQVSRSQMLRVIRRIANSVEIPVSADIETGYGDTPAAVGETIRQVIDAGAVGINIEDGCTDGANPLVEREQHTERIRVARKVAESVQMPLVINGRTDVFWQKIGDPTHRANRAIERANAYLEAGSDCVFIPGVTNIETIETLVNGIDGPLNVLAGPGTPSIGKLEDVGVGRVSVGSGPMRATLGLLQNIAEEIHTNGTYNHMASPIPYDELNQMLSTSYQRHKDL